jgi:putative ABC transport system substrate-binding protein
MKEYLQPVIKTTSVLFRFLFCFWIISCLLINLQACSKVDQTSESYLVGIINPNKGILDISKGFIEGLTSQGYVEGKNIEYIRVLNTLDLDKALEKMIASNVDLVFTVTTPATIKAYSALKEKGIPVVFSLYDPVSGGVIKSLANPGENITGVQFRGSVSKALDWFLRFSPEIKNIFVPVKYDSPATKLSLSDLQKAADIKGITLFVHELSSSADIKKTFEAEAQNIDAVFMVHSIFISSHTEEIVQEAMKYGLPVGGGTSSYTKGAMITYGVFAKEVGKQASRMANLVLQGTQAGEIPAETAEFYMGINMEIAIKAGITIPSDILVHADDIIPYKKNGKQ